MSPRNYRQFSSRSRPTAALSGFLHLSHTFDGPLRYGASVRFETTPSNPCGRRARTPCGHAPLRRGCVADVCHRHPRVRSGGGLPERIIVSSRPVSVLRATPPLRASPIVGDGCAGPLKPRMFQASRRAGQLACGPFRCPHGGAQLIVTESSDLR